MKKKDVQLTEARKKVKEGAEKLKKDEGEKDELAGLTSEEVAREETKKVPERTPEQRKASLDKYTKTMRLGSKAKKAFMKVMSEKYPNFDINNEKDKKFLKQLSAIYKMEHHSWFLKNPNYETVWLATIYKFEEPERLKKGKERKEKIKTLAKYIRDRNRDVEWEDRIMLDKGHVEALHDALLEHNTNFDFGFKKQADVNFLEECLKRGDKIGYLERGNPNNWIALAETISKESATGTRVAATKKPKK